MMPRGRRGCQKYSSLALNPDWKNYSDLSERLACLGITGDKLRASLKLPVHHSTVTYGGFQGGPQLGPPDAERRQSLGQL